MRMRNRWRREKHLRKEVIDETVLVLAETVKEAEATGGNGQMADTPEGYLQET